jgi:hypothetical protein
MDDAEAPQISEASVKKARKSYVCCECSCVIPVAAQYWYCRGKWEYGFETYTMCLPCSKARTSVMANCDPMYSEHGPAFGALWEWIDEAESWDSGEQNGKKLPSCCMRCQHLNNECEDPRISGGWYCGVGVWFPFKSKCCARQRREE